VVIADRLRILRNQKKPSQGDIEKRTVLLRYYLSRVENGHTVPSVATLEKRAKALEVPLYEFFYQGKEPPEENDPPKSPTRDNLEWDSSGKDARMLAQFRRVLAKINTRNLKILLSIAQGMARR